ncbi:M20/M25/M40 family metallo-hydrolase [candidate division KSB1 bacterium]
MKTRGAVFQIILLVVLFTSSVIAQEFVDWEVVRKIREEGFQRSQVMDITWHMTELVGPRLSGSPDMREAQLWAIQKMDEIGMVNTALEPWGEFGIGWTNEYTSVHMMEPRYTPLIGYSKAWTEGTNGKKVADAVIVDIQTRDDFIRYIGQLRNKVVLSQPPRFVELGFEPDARRYTDEEVMNMSKYQLPVEAPERARGERDPNIPSRDELNEFYRSEGVVAVFDRGSKGDDGTIFITGGGSRNPNDPRAIPALTIAVEQYNRMYRLAERGYTVTVELDIRNTYHTDDLMEYNVIGEFPGTDLADEVVIVGAHYDSWHTSTGATDIASGCACAIEAVRILKAIGVQPRRTIRVALWSAEEQGLIGSREYVNNHFGTRDNKKPEYDKLCAYFQHDGGTGRARAISIQSNPEMIPIFSAWMEPFHDLGFTAITGHHSVSSGGTDHASFLSAGLNGFSFSQDRIQYSTKTHHSNMDGYDNLIAEDVIVNAVITASFIYHAAMRDEILPKRKMN